MPGMKKAIGLLLVLLTALVVASASAQPRFSRRCRPRSWPIRRCGISRPTRAKSICWARCMSCQPMSIGARRRSCAAFRAATSSSSKCRRTPKSMQELQGLIQAKGYLADGPEPEGRARAPRRFPIMTPPCGASGLPAAAVDHERPWLAGIQLMFAQMENWITRPDNGVDSTLMAEAAKTTRRCAISKPSPNSSPCWRPMIQAGTAGIRIRPQGPA